MSQASRTVTYKVKNDGFIGSTRVMAHAARRVAEHLGAYPFLQDCFGLDVTLVLRFTNTALVSRLWGC